MATCTVQRSPLDQALGYANRGWPVFPVHSAVDGGCTCAKGAHCTSPAKHPRTANGHKEATTDEAAIREWWGQWPEANIGIATGEASGIVVLDVDHGGEDTLYELCGEYGQLPDTVTVLTGSGGRHLYFRHPGGYVGNSQGRLGPGLDVRGDGGYVVAPPSMHVSGRTYEWEASSHPDEVPLADMPGWLTNARHREGPSERLSLRDTLKGVPEGGRDDAIFRLAAWARGADLPKETAAALAVLAARNCTPPFPEDQALQKVEWAYSHYQPNRFDSTRIEEERGERKECAVGVASNHSFNHGLYRDESNLPFGPLGPSLETDDDKEEWLWEDFLAPDSITLLSACPKVGKTTLVFAALHCLTKGEPCLGRETRASGVLLLTEERKRSLREKYRVWPLDSSRVHVLYLHDAQGVPWDAIVRRAVDYCREHHLEVLVVDTFAEWAGFRRDEENQTGPMLEALRPLKNAAGEGLSVLLVSHQRKAHGEHGAAVRGNNALTGGVDIVIELERPTNQTLANDKGTRVLKFSTRFGNAPPELVITLDGAEYTVVGDSFQAKAAAEKRQVLAALERLYQAEVEAVGAKAGLSKGQAQKRLNELLAEDQVVRAGAGVKGNPYLWSLASETASAEVLPILAAFARAWEATPQCCAVCGTVENLVGLGDSDEHGGDIEYEFYCVEHLDDWLRQVGQLPAASRKLLRVSTGESAKNPRHRHDDL
jgi:hypothetical protein